MGSSDKDKELLENLDKLLKDREREIAESPDDDKATLEFAQKVAALGEQPSNEFREKLKAQIVQRLAETEKKEKDDTELTFWGVPRRKLWQGTLAALIPFIIVLVIYLVMVLLNK